MLLVCVGSSPAPAQDQITARQPPFLDPKALWQPDMSIMQAMRDECGSFKWPKFEECLVSVMERSGATAEAVAFTRLIGNSGYMYDFREAGQVDIAYVHYPFRANENWGCLLVNGLPSVIDVDDRDILPLKELEKDRAYLEISKKFPDATVWPGYRYGTGLISVKTLPDGGQRFVVPYHLLNGCHACALIGSVRFAFDFDRTGKFLGAVALGTEDSAEFF